MVRDIIHTIFEVFDKENIDYYLTNGLFVFMLWYHKDKISKAAAGSDGIWQWPEILQVVCLFLFICYSLRVIFMEIDPNVVVFTAFIGGAGIGGTMSILDKKLKDKNNEE